MGDFPVLQAPPRTPWSVVPVVLPDGVSGEGRSTSWVDLGEYPLVMTNIAIENGHRNSGFSH